MRTSFDNGRPYLTLGYDLDAWNEQKQKVPIKIDLSPKANSHTLLCGMSGSGKSYLEHQVLGRLMRAEQNRDGEYYFADYKGDDTFIYLQNCPQFFTYKSTLQALDIVHSRLLARQSGEDSSRNPVTLIWDEYMAQTLNLISTDKKAAAAVMGKVSEILLLGRSLSVRLVVACQRPDALAFPAGSRLNYGVVVVLGAAVRSIYEMLLPDHMEQVKGRQFHRGEGVVLLQGSKLCYLKVPTLTNEEHLWQLCMTALDPHRPPCEA